jgi:DNA repair exonuclease SbcCD nuclease subunit
MRFTFVHAADLHLDSPLGWAGRVDARLRPLFENATFKAFERIVDICLARKASFLLLAGDLFDQRDRSVQARLFLRDQLARLATADIRTFVVHGNHDPLSGERGTLRLPLNVKVFGPEWEEVSVHLEGRLACRIQGISYPIERVEENLALRFGRRGPEFTVGLLHANVGGNAAHANYAAARWEDLSAADLSYWALGHVHTRAEHRLGSGGWAVYPGNPQGRHAWEPGPRGCVVVQVEDGHCALEFVPVDSVRWHQIRLDLSPCDTLENLEAAALAGVDARCGSGLDAHAVRLVLEGRSALHTDLARQEDREALEALLRETLRRRPCPVVLEALQVETQPALDFEALRAEGGLCTTLFAQAESLESEQLLREGGLRSLEDSLRRTGVPALSSQAPALLAAAAHRAAELLSEEGR